ncbi:hypothetical protein KTD31_03405 [Burkholderia multivorans]|uniref:hypothetical protein n=1 Tax=Burkholderia multivorans TaxID=87883 RepID=UPI001C237AE8|nr:hypothetical protein [Burkholderia multivorans]MBU9200400.1 hypothetical protein [Burkholderia multivorans]
MKKTNLFRILATVATRAKAMAQFIVQAPSTPTTREEVEQRYRQCAALHGVTPFPASRLGK